MARVRLRGGFTTRGSCLFAAGVTAVVCGFALGEVDLLRAGLLVAVVPWIASALVTRARLHVGARRRVEPSRVDAGQRVTVAVDITNGAALPTATLLLEDRLPRAMQGRARFVLPPLRGRQTRTVSYRIPGLPRGRHRIGPLQVRLADPFGLVQVTRSFATTTDVVATPVVEDLRGAGTSRADDLGGASAGHSIGTHGEDDAATREYRVGDDLRKIHWRSTARTGTVMVRQEEQTWEPRSAVLLDLRAEAHAQDDPDVEDPRERSSLEWAVSLAASIGTDALRRRRQLTLVSDPRSGAPTVAGPQALLDRLAEIGPLGAGHTSVPALLDGLRGASSLIAVLGRLSAEDVSALLAHGRGDSRSLTAVLLDVDSWAGSAPAGAPGDVPVAAAAGALVDAGWRAVVARRGEAMPDVWDRLSSRSIGAA